MAGGPDSPELAAAVSNAGGLGSIGCAYLSIEGIEAVGSAVRRLTDRPFALNLFVRQEPEPEPEAERRVQPVLDAFRAELGLDPGPFRTWPREQFDRQLEAVLRVRPAVFSFTFGVPTRAQLAALRDAGIYTIGTATTVVEALALDDAGVDAICAQGSEAGGHRGTFIGRFEDGLVGTLALVPQIARRTRRPVIAAGGIMDGAGLRAALGLGARAVQLGTAFMDCPEAGTHPSHRTALRSPDALCTVITRAFSGRPARGIRNRLSDRFEHVEPGPFPLQQRWTADLRAAAAAADRPDLMQLWAGQGAPLVRSLPAAELLAVLMREAG